jgi:hypothetical protein
MLFPWPRKALLLFPPRPCVVNSKTTALNNVDTANYYTNYYYYIEQTLQPEINVINAMIYIGFTPVINSLPFYL